MIERNFAAAMTCEFSDAREALRFAENLLGRGYVRARSTDKPKRGQFVARRLEGKFVIVYRELWSEEWFDLVAEALEAIRLLHLGPREGIGGPCGVPYCNRKRAAGKRICWKHFDMTRSYKRAIKREGIA